MSTTIEKPRIEEIPVINSDTTDSSGGSQGGGWKVIVLNDNHNTFDGVAGALAKYIPGVDFNKGMKMAEEIHNNGRSIVWVGQREPAELYWEQLNNFGLTLAQLEQG